MGSEAEPEAISTPKLALFWNPQAHGCYMRSPQRSGTTTPPLYASAAVPFRWEEEPGKPRSSTALSNPIDFGPKCLELPPRLFLLDGNNVSKLSLPTTVLEEPYMGKPRFQSSSFRMIRKECYGSFRRSFSPERRQLSTMVLSKRGINDSKRFLGSWRWGRRAFTGTRENVGGASYVFPSSMDREEIYFGQEEDEEEEENKSCKNNVTITRIRRSGSISSRARSHFWAAIYEGLKQVVPWRSKKLKDGFAI
ncbi:hypothetical protein JCGZ_14243 [Jatropha curcas]|uniref:Uncharacterized protein n=1 Tax=Jatropha curcas TaxID=180498 RepID=A0A067JX63_JATCU|nr:uncharacterized protein At4g00950 [Jatropha curcas]KDP28472.1 hypothetical protein JCGZ_14243 [Jatropha curcas]